MIQPVIFAHRGASAYAPENTMASFRKAIEHDAGGIELDVRMTKDGYIVVIHDDKVDRTSNGTGRVSDMTLNELRELDFGSWFSYGFSNERIPLLDEVLELMRDWNGILNIEIKDYRSLESGIEQNVLDLVYKHCLSKRVIISSFNHYSLVHIHNIDPDILTGALYMEMLYKPWEYAAKIGARAIHPYFRAITPEIIDGCIAHGIEVNAFTIDNPVEIRFIAQSGVTGIITNVPDIAKSICDSITYK